ncbi:lactonase family protein [Roseinatronobacter alkalisoli]|uniref:Beta-propeller fold lactonase family protein n=1 Tax=Roseinatronobacter alkalisoli TaxID=3028235 RepID=A0ABT5TH93_9RHOB|nr:beta-propeller fold lactonase family protein [Roseinatronobacter sp. HJB301]MDD7973293.1 beta-propeller fold lactonase family protein [Roseinatronobacter sp. HJB301]
MERAAESLLTARGDLVLVALAGQAAIALCILDPATGSLETIDEQPLPGAEGACRGVPMAASADGERIYLAWRGDKFRLFSFALDRAARRLNCLGSTHLPASMCYLTLSSCGQSILTSSNTGSVIAVCPIDDNGCAGDPILTQKAFKAHCVMPAPNGLVYATSLRGDFVQCYRFDAIRGYLEMLSRLNLLAGSGPRHIRFTSDGTRAYLLSEFKGLLTCLNVDGRTGALSVRQSVTLLSEADTAWAAELRLAADETQLYASERTTSQIFTYSLDAEGEMRLGGIVAGPDCPSAFGLSRTGKHLIALGEKSGEVWTYRIGRDGQPNVTSRLKIGAVPSWVLAL